MSFHEQYQVDVFGRANANTNWSTLTITTAALKSAYLVSSGTQNAEVQFSATLRKGTWTIQLLYRKDSDHGIIHIEIDGVQVGTIDSYDASALHNQRTSVTGVTISADGRHTIKLKVASKNASSSSYVAAVNGLGLTRTGA